MCTVCAYVLITEKIAYLLISTQLHQIRHELPLACLRIGHYRHTTHSLNTFAHAAGMKTEKLCFVL